jgi:hypothetical protein
MAIEPERPIENLLRAAAKKRRDDAGAPLELHPATRRLLQGEAARKFAAAQRPSRLFFQGLAQLWPRFAWGVGMLAALTVIVWLLVPAPVKNGPHALLAKNQPVPAPGPAATELVHPSNALATSPSPPLEERAGERRASAPGPLNPIAVPPAAPKEALPSPLTAQAPAAAPPAPAAAAKTTTIALADAVSSARRTPAPEVAGQPQPLPKDRLTSETGGEVREKLALATAPQPANREKPAEAEVAASSTMSAPAPAAVANGAFAKRFGLVGQPAAPAGAPAAPASPSSVATAPAVTHLVTADESKKLAVDRADQPAFAFRSLSPAGSVNTLKPSDSLTDGRLDSAAALRKEARSISTTQWFAQMPQSTKTKRSLDDQTAPAHPVLAAFQVEQAGRELRIVDGDGSVYSGYLQLADAARRRSSATAEAPAAARPSRALGTVLEEKSKAIQDADQPAPQTYFFRVTGTNRSLQKKVVFTGNLLSATNLALFQVVTNDLKISGSLVGLRGGAGQPAPLPLLNSRISGKVVIGNAQAVEINALPASP